jgi:hypothetical protein
VTWATSHVFVTGELVTAAAMNQIYANIDTLDSYLGASTVYFAEDSTGATTFTSTSYAADSPAVSVTVPNCTSALVFADAVSSGPAGQALYMSVAVSGATTVAATDGTGVRNNNTSGNDNALHLMRKFTSLTAGSNVFTINFKVSGGTAFPNYRRLAVLPIRT